MQDFQSSLGPIPVQDKYVWSAIKCPCKHVSCKNWLIKPVACVQGVWFTEEEAKWIAEAHNAAIPE